MRPYVIALTMLMITYLSLSLALAQSFKAEQLRYPRVKGAFAEKEPLLSAIFAQQQLPYPPKRIFIRVFKREGTLELWASPASGAAFHLVKAYPICASSGSLGPKRQQGDRQVPEGFYTIDRFNPTSSFHLSLGLNFPNQADRLLGVNGRWGGDIFIHGDCVTIGCVPLTDEGIKEFYVLAVEARSAGQRHIPVHVFPSRLTDEGMRALTQEFSAHQELLGFWGNLREGFEYFERRRHVPSVTVDGRGRYLFPHGVRGMGER